MLKKLLSLLSLIALVITIVFSSCSEAKKSEQLLPGAKVKVIVDFVAVDYDGAATESQFAAGNIAVH